MLKFFLKYRYISALEVTSIALVIFILMSIALPRMEGNAEEAERILTVSTFLFAILIGFYITRLNARYDAVASLIGKEDALWLSAYRMLGLVGVKEQKKVANAIDAYYLTVFDYEPGSAYKQSIKEFEEVYKEVNQIKKKMTDDQLSDIMSILTNIEETRNLSSQTAREHLRLDQWIVVSVLGFIIVTCLFYLKGSGFFSPAVTVMLSTILTLIVFLMRDLEQFRISGELVAEESGEEVFECMGKPRYYSVKYLYSDPLKEGYSCYRLGITNPKTGEKTVKLITKKEK